MCLYAKYCLYLQIWVKIYETRCHNFIFAAVKQSTDFLRNAKALAVTYSFSFTNKQPGEAAVGAVQYPVFFKSGQYSLQIHWIELYRYILTS